MNRSLHFSSGHEIKTEISDIPTIKTKLYINENSMHYNLLVYQN